MLTVGSTSKLKNGQQTDLVIVATFDGMDHAFLEKDFEDRLNEELERLRDELLLLRTVFVETLLTPH